MSMVRHADLDAYFMAETAAANADLFRCAFIGSLSAFVDAESWRFCVEQAREADARLAEMNAAVRR